jgi:threonine synthase
MSTICCVQCNREYPTEGVPYRCMQCGGVFDFDSPSIFDQIRIDKNKAGLWRYRHTLELPAEAPEVTLGEGNTPLVWIDIERNKVGFKLEMLNPSGSYKDRGTSVLASQLLQRGVKEAVEDSSGNAGASFAAYAARAGIKARIFVPESASGPKRLQIERYGAELVSIPGPRSAAASAVLEEVVKGATYASHAYLPFGIPGIATIAYEIFEQMDGIPGTMIMPVGHGGLMLGVLRGFQSLFQAGVIKTVPYFVGVQAAACAPAVAAFMAKDKETISVVELPTIAEGVRVRHPVRVDAILKELKPSGGEFIAVSEERILPAFNYLAHKGLYVEPTSAITWAAYETLKEKLPEPVVIILTGSGLKYNS